MFLKTAKTFKTNKKLLNYQLFNISHLAQVKLRDQYFLGLLNSNKNVTLNELDNIARVLAKTRDVGKEHWNIFDDLVIKHSKDLDMLALRKVMSAYVNNCKHNEYAFYQINERFFQLKLKEDKLTKEAYYNTYQNRKANETYSFLAYQFLYSLRLKFFRLFRKLNIDLK